MVWLTEAMSVILRLVFAGAHTKSLRQCTESAVSGLFSANVRNDSISVLTITAFANARRATHYSALRWCSR